MKNTSFLLIVGVVCLILVGSYTGFSYWQKYTAEANLEAVEKSLKGYKEDMLQIENQRVLQAISAKNLVSEIRGDIIVWSEIIQKIRSVVPVVGKANLVDILSYSGSVNSDISMSVRTIPDRDNPYFDVADLIKKFSDNSQFEDVFVSSISKGTNTDGEEVLSFPMKFKYVGETKKTEKD